MNYQYASAGDLNGGIELPPPPPPLSTTLYNMQAATAAGSGGSTFRPNPKLTANAVPRPYPGSPTAGGAGGSLLATNSGVSGAKLTQSPTSKANVSNYNQQQQQKSFENITTATTTIAGNAAHQPQLPQQKSSPAVNHKLEACVQDLHDKTFGQGGVVQITGAGAYPGQNYEGYTSR